MRRTLGLITAMLIAAPLAARAQGGFGLRGGYSYGNVSNNGVLPGDARQRTGFALGVGVSTGSPIGIGMEALYAQRGVTSTTAADPRQLNYLARPVYLRCPIPSPA